MCVYTVQAHHFYCRHHFSDCIGVFELQVCEHGKFYIQFTKRYECVRAYATRDKRAFSDKLVFMVNYNADTQHTRTYSQLYQVPGGNLGLGCFNLNFMNTHPISSYGRFNYFCALHFPSEKHAVKCPKIELENMAQASLYDCKIYIKEPLPSAYHMAHISFGIEMLLLCSKYT